MNWFEKYNEKLLINDLILRDPFTVKIKDINNIFLGEGFLNISYAKLQDINFMNLSLLSVLKDLSSGNKVNLKRTKVIAGKKINKLSVKLVQNKLFYFLDFFLHMIIKGLKRRYVNLKVAQTNTGLLNIRFSHISELDLDDFFFFDLYEWHGSLNILLKIPLIANVKINNLYNKAFIDIFNLKNLLKNEVSNRKG